MDAMLPALTLNNVIADFGAGALYDRSGTPIPLRPQAFAVLRCLAERPGRLVSKDELMAAVWPVVAVTDDSLVQAIGDIRRAIGDEAHAVIRTVPRRGYRLVPPKTDAEPSTRIVRKWIVAAGVAAVLAVGGAGAW
jgi:DNA-binding winged helix-turn-helix (wHTH) protein